MSNTTAVTSACYHHDDVTFKHLEILIYWFRLPWRSHWLVVTAVADSPLNSCIIQQHSFLNKSCGWESWYQKNQMAITSLSQCTHSIGTCFFLHSTVVPMMYITISNNSRRWCLFHYPCGCTMHSTVICVTWSIESVTTAAMWNESTDVLCRK